MDVLLNKRRAIKGQLTRFENIVIGHSTQPLQNTAIKKYQEKAEKLLNELETLQEAIVIGSSAADFDTHEADFNLLIGRAESINIFFFDFLSQCPVTIPQASTAQTAADIKLPKAELPTFNGNFIEWFSFHDLFTAMVHNSSLSGAQKLQYLKSSLRGEAALLIQSILVTDGNYLEAWNILLKRYNNTREIIDAHLKRLFNQPVIKEESAASIRCLIDTTTECIRSLKVLKEPVDQWDSILLHIVKEKIDPASRRQWELSLNGTGRPTFQELTMFLEQRARALMATQTSHNNQKTRFPIQPRKTTLTHHGTRNDLCSICKEAHPVYQCEILLRAKVDERWKLVKEKSLCYNCLRADHQVPKCRSGNCRKCQSKHNTLLHQDSRPREESMSAAINCLVSRESCPVSQVILATAIIQIELPNGTMQSVRALLDSGSQASFISEQCTRKLQLKRTRLIVAVGGVGATGVGTSRGSVHIIIKPSDGSQSIYVNALILKKVTENLPNVPVNTDSWTHIKNLKLADATFYRPERPGPIDMILGADVYLRIIRDGIRIGRPGTAGSFNTVFGWVICGPTASLKSTNLDQEINVHTSTIDDQLAKFWEIEEICPKRALTASEQQCEDNFLNTYSRNGSGRFIVRLPFNNSIQLGDSRKMSQRRFTYIEKRLQANANLYKQY